APLPPDDPPPPLPTPPPIARSDEPAQEPLQAAARAAPGYWVQLGAFRQRDGAEVFQRRIVADVDWLAPRIALLSESGLYKLQAGPYASRAEAQGAAGRVRDALSLVPVIVERR